MMSYDMKKTGDRIRQLRTQKGYTQEQIAQALNIDRSFYGRIELGQKGCSVDFLIRLSSFFAVSLDYLVLGKDPSEALCQKTREVLKADVVKVISQLEKLMSKL